MVKTKEILSLLVVQWFKDLVVSLQWLGSLLWHGSDPWSGNAHMPWAQPKETTNKQEQPKKPFPNKLRSLSRRCKTQLAKLTPLFDARTEYHQV